MRIHIVSHTHWDREWYRPFSYFRVKLSYFFNHLFHTLENDEFKHFMLDGQMVMIEDYLQLHPQNKPKIKDLVKKGKLIIGPWYSQPDEFMPDGESLIRNLLIGNTLAQEFGKNMPIGYLPDSFGHSGQLPHILKGANIHSACVMRGVPIHKLKNTDFLWKGVNGDSVISVALSTGYSNGMFMPKTKIPFLLRIKRAKSEMKNLPDLSHLLIMNGVDHQFAQPQIPNLIAKSNKSYVHSTLEDFISEIQEEDLDVIEGELISPVTNRVHTSIASTRMRQKKLNRKMERMLERRVEPICTLAWLKGADYPEDLINDTWKNLLKNQIHDSICGCCTDEVHRDIDRRYFEIETTANTLINMHSRALTSATAQNGLSLLVFNAAMTRGKQIVKGTVYTDSKDFKLLDDNGTEIYYEIEDIKIVDAAQFSIWSLYLDTPCMIYQNSISFELDFDFQCGYLKYEIIDGEPASVQNESKPIESNIIENQYSIITINQNGTFDLFDKETEIKFQQLNTIEDMGDAGDTYNYSPVKEDSIITNSEVKDCHIEILEKELKTVAKIKYSLMLPEKLVENDFRRSSERIKQPIEVYITSYKNLKRIDIKTIIQNNVKDHRMRALFPTQIKTYCSHAEIQFGTIKRDNSIKESNNWKELGFKEQPLPIYSQQKFVYINGNDIGMAVLNRGLTEYEIYKGDESTIAITLFRGVGSLGKPDLIVRPGRPSGMPISTPDAEELGMTTSEYSVLILDSSPNETEIARQAVMFDTPATITQSHIKLTRIQKKMKHLMPLFDMERLQDQVLKKIMVDPKSYVEVNIESDELLVSAFKKAEAENAIILRVYNPKKILVNPTKIHITTPIKDIFECNFLELNINRLHKEKDQNAFITRQIKGFSAQTYKILLNIKDEHK